MLDLLTIWLVHVWLSGRWSLKLVPEHVLGSKGCWYDLGHISYQVLNGLQLCGAGNIQKCGAGNTKMWSWQHLHYILVCGEYCLTLFLMMLKLNLVNIWPLNFNCLCKHHVRYSLVSNIKRDAILYNTSREIQSWPSIQRDRILCQASREIQSCTKHEEQYNLV